MWQQSATANRSGGATTKNATVEQRVSDGDVGPLAMPPPAMPALVPAAASCWSPHLSNDGAILPPSRAAVAAAALSLFTRASHNSGNGNGGGDGGGGYGNTAPVTTMPFNNNLLHAPACAPPTHVLPIELLADIFLRLNTCLLNASATTSPPPSPSAALHASGVDGALPLYASASVLPTAAVAALASAYGNGMPPQQRQQLHGWGAPPCSKLACAKSRRRSAASAGRVGCAELVQQAARDMLLQRAAGMQAAEEAQAVADDDLLPPPKKKWIRHYLKEDAFSSNNDTSITPTTTTPTTPHINLNAAYLLLAADQRDQQPTMTHLRRAFGNETAAATASKQMLLNGGKRIASPTAVIGSLGAVSNAIAIPQQKQSQQSLLTNNNNNSYPHKAQSTPHSLTLTPPPMATRKILEPQTSTRIRSFSLSSHKFTAHNNNNSSGSNRSSPMIIDDAIPSHLSPMPASSAPSAGCHYMQLIAAGQQQSGGSGVGSPGSIVLGSPGAHVASPIAGGSGRRRTISSNSNGAGTREVHNKLEKNRRAHLKECYEALKNELPLKDDDRKKVSNLAILAEAYRLVNKLQRDDKHLDADCEELSKEKIMLQKRLASLRRELGIQQPEKELTATATVTLASSSSSSIPKERDGPHESGVMLASRRGSMLYSSTSSISSSGGSSNTMSSPIGAGLQTAIPTAISPVITNNSSSSNSASQQQQQQQNLSNNAATIIAAAETPILPRSILQHLKNSATISTTVVAHNNNNNNNTITCTANNSPAVSPNNNTSVALSLTAKNISATAMTRGSPTPSTPSPSSTSSGVSSSSSPPMNSVVNGTGNGVVVVGGGGGGGGGVVGGNRSVVTVVNIPNGGTTALVNGNKFHQTAATAAAAIISSANNATATAGNSNNVNVANHNNNHSGGGNSNTKIANDVAMPNGYHHRHLNGMGRKTSCEVINNNGNNNTKATTSEDGEQPTKLLKVYNGGMGAGQMLGNGNGNAAGGNGGTLLLSSVSYQQQQQQQQQAQQQQQQQVQQHFQKMFGATATAVGEIGRLPGGAELNILPTNNNNTNNNSNGMKPLGAYYHANGKLTLLNASTANGVVVGTGGGGANLNGGINGGGVLLTEGNVAVSSAATASHMTPLLLTTSAGNFAQLIAAATASSNNSNNNNSISSSNNNNGVAVAANAPAAGAPVVPLERLNGKFRLLLGAQPQPPRTAVKHEVHNINNNNNNNCSTNNNNNALSS